jgi:methylmalonyl-CoA mutase cobalamin-binding subunit
VTSNFSANSSVEPGELEERLKMLRQDIETIATVIATTTNKPVKDIEQAMVDRVVLNAEDAKKWGLVQEVRSKLYEEGAEVISITDNKPTQGSTLLQTSITDPWPFTIFTQWSAAMTHLQDVSTLPPK